MSCSSDSFGEKELHRGQFDWRLSDALELDEFHLSSHDNKSSRFLKGFAHAWSFSAGTSSQYEHLLELAQKAVRSLTRTNLKLSIELEKSRKMPLANKEFTCPICLTSLDSLTELDSHIILRHGDKGKLWSQLRQKKESKKDTRDNYTDILSELQSLPKTQPTIKRETIIEPKTVRPEKLARETRIGDIYDEPGEIRRYRLV